MGSNQVDNRVGRNTPTPTPTPAPTQTPAASKPGSLTSVLNSKLSIFLPEITQLVAGDIKIDQFVESLSDKQLRTVGAVLDKAGYTVRRLQDIRTILSEDFSGLNLSNFNQFVSSLRKELTMFNAPKEENIPTRQIYKYDANVLRDVADSISIKRRGEVLSDAEWQEELDRVNKKIAKGTLTVTKEVTNPKTGKKERVVTTTPAFTQEGFETELGKRLEEKSPELVERRKAFEFIGELNKTLAGGM